MVELARKAGMSKTLWFKSSKRLDMPILQILKESLKADRNACPFSPNDYSPN